MSKDMKQRKNICTDTVGTLNWVAKEDLFETAMLECEVWKQESINQSKNVSDRSRTLSRW